MGIEVIFASIAAVIYLIMAVFVYSKSRQNPINRSFAIFLLCVSIWNIDVVGIRIAPNAEFADIWGKLFRTGLLFIPPALLHFIILFTNLNKISKWAGRYLRFFCYLSITLSIINWTPYFTGGVQLTKRGYQTLSGPLYPVFIAQFLAAILLSFIFLLHGYRRADQYQRHRFKYFFLALVVSLFMGAFGFLPMFEIEIIPISQIAPTIGLLIGAYSVTQHRLMDVSMFMSKGVGYLLTVLVFVFPVFFLLLLVENYFFQKSNMPFTLMVLLLGSFCAIFFDPVKKKIDSKVQKIIIRDKFFYHQIIEQFSRSLVTIVDLQRLLSMLGEIVQKSMGITDQVIFLFNSEKETYSPVFTTRTQESLKNISFRKTDPFPKWMEEKKEGVLLKHELENLPKGSRPEMLLKGINQLQGEVCLPLYYLDRMIGFIILGKKAEGEMYYREDLNLLVVLANQIAIAVENANLYESLKRSQMIMRRADRLASLGTLVAGLAHEIRNPLVSIKTFTQLLPERMDDEEFRNYFLTVASGEIDRLTTLINELLGFAKPTEPNLKGENVNSIIDKMEFLVSTEAKKKNITITKNYSPNLPPVMADAEQIKQVLLNILLNGMQAIEGDQGRVWIETRVARVPREGGIEPFVQIEIRDNGVGISQENLDHIFDPFFTTRPEGSGLGLAITYQIVHEHGGFIDVESEIGKGTSFLINFPLKAGANGSPQPE